MSARRHEAAPPAERDIATVAAAAERLGLGEGLDAPQAAAGVAVAVIESVWSIGVRAESASRVVARYAAARAAEGADAGEDTPAQLVAFVEGLGGAETFAERMANRQRTSTRAGILKAEAVLLEARMLAEEGIRRPEDLLAADERRLEELAARWATVPGQGSLVSWRAFLMGLGRSEVKPDRMIRRFVAEALGRRNAGAVGVEEARLLVSRAADRLGRDARELDFAIWRHQRDAR